MRMEEMDLALQLVMIAVRVVNNEQQDLFHLMWLWHRFFSFKFTNDALKIMWYLVKNATYCLVDEF